MMETNWGFSHVLFFEANIEGWGQSWEGAQGSVCRETLQGGHPRSLG